MREGRDMGRILDYENPIFRFMSRLVDLLILNALTLAGCIPVVTIGASITAAHYTALKLHRGESYVWRNFWKSFKENLKQSTIIWLLFVAFFVVEYLAFITLSNGEAEGAMTMQGCILATAVFGVCFMLWAFPMQSKFENSIGKTLCNAFVATYKHIFRTVLMLAVGVLPFLLNINWFGVLLLYGFSVPIYLCAMIYNKPFQKMEEVVYENLKSVS